VKKPIRIANKAVSGDAAMSRVIDAQARADSARREMAALKKDRNQILREYTDLLHARTVPSFSGRAKVSVRAGLVRVACGDVHGMMMDRAAVNAFLADLKTLDPDEIVLGGDIVECGGWLAKHQPLGYVAACNYTYQEDIQAAGWFLDEIQKAAPKAKIYYIEGNHENRVERWIVDQTMAQKRDSEFLRQAFAPEVMLRLKDRGVVYCRRSEIYGQGLPRGWIKLGKMFYTHELGGGKNAAREAAVRTAGNVTFFHTHREDTATVVFPGVGLVKAFNPGCLCQMQPLWRHSDPTNWSQGYAIDFVAPSGNFQHVHVPIWRGESLAVSMVDRFRGG
jgi:hypothetical protein